MFRQSFKDRHVANAAYDRFLRGIASHDATFTAKSHTSGWLGVWLTDCQLAYDDEMQVAPVDKLDKADLEKHWQGLLDLCDQAGFEQI